MDINLNELIGATTQVTTKGKANFYSLQFSFRNRQENFSVCLPDNMNAEFLKEMCTYLSSFSESNCALFNPVGQEDNVYESLPYGNISESWEKIYALMNESLEYKKGENKAKIPLSNLSICELRHGRYHYYLCAKQQPTAKLFMGRKVIMSTNDEIKPYPSNKVFLFGCNVDFVIRVSQDGSSTHVFILNRKNFINIFNYHEYLQNEVKKHSTDIRQWSFLASADLVIAKIAQKNVYRNLAKIFADTDYVKQMSNVAPSVLKKRLLEKSGGKFTEADFQKDKIEITSQNLDKVMKMLAKGFKYNFFTDKAEGQ